MHSIVFFFTTDLFLGWLDNLKKFFNQSSQLFASWRPITFSMLQKAVTWRIASENFNPAKSTVGGCSINFQFLKAHFWKAKQKIVYFVKDFNQFDRIDVNRFLRDRYQIIILYKEFFILKVSLYNNNFNQFSCEIYFI